MTYIPVINHFENRDGGKKDCNLRQNQDATLFSEACIIKCIKFSAMSNNIGRLQGWCLTINQKHTFMFPHATYKNIFTREKKVMKNLLNTIKAFLPLKK